MNKVLLYLSFGFVLILNISAIQYSSNPPTGYTSAPGQANCTSCHVGGKLNPANGTFSILFNNGINTYKPGQTYPVKVSISEVGIKTWGFEMVVFPGVVGTSSNASIGNFSTVGTNLIITSVGTSPNIRQYISHNVTGQLNDTQSWTFNWIAPANASGPITFYAAGNAADGNGIEYIDPKAVTKGDDIFTKSLTINQIITGLENSAELKSETYLYSSGNKIFVGNLEKTWESLEIDVIDTKGNLIKKIITTSADLNNGLEVTELNPGVYITNFSMKNKLVKGKIVIE
ncbi:MAG: hypothetical protein H7329_00370 [Opitutaceae bacterium]|nr:hypothetical protein [Cytophagales bacterium]